MWITKIVSILFAALLLYPVARTFYEMCSFEMPPESEERPQDLPPPSEGSNSGPSFAIFASQTYYAVSPFVRFHRFLGFGPRKWVGGIGLTATALVFVLLTYSAIFPLEGASYSYEWKDEVESAADFQATPGTMITWDEESASTLELKPDEKGENDQSSAAPESKP